MSPHCNYLIVQIILLCSASPAIHAQALERKYSLGIGYVVENISYESTQRVGVVVRSVQHGAPASGLLEVDDVILSFNGNSFYFKTDGLNFPDLTRAVRLNDSITMEVLRKNKKIIVLTRVSALPNESSERIITEYGTTPDGVLRTIVNRPLTGSSLPAVLIVQGLPCASIDSPFTKDNAYRKIAERVAEKGFVVMRVEKSGVGDSEGKPCSQTGFTDEVAGFRAALQELKSRDDINQKKVFILGHSTGGFMAPLIADQEVAGITVYGTVSRSWFEYWLAVRKLQNYKSGMQAADLERSSKMLCACASAFLFQQKSVADVVHEESACQEHLQLFTMRSEIFWREANNITIADYWQNFNGKVLSVWGSADDLILADDQSYIADIINRNHPGNGRYKVLRDTDHNFRKIKTGHPITSTQPSFNEAYVRLIAEWMRSIQR